MSDVARSRLTQERKQWRKDKPYLFNAKPETVGEYVSTYDNKGKPEINLMKWNCQIPGKEGTIWEGGLYPLTLQFTEDYPAKPPKCSFPQHFFHPNVYPSGAICLSIVNENEGWRPNITVKQILLGIQELLNNPNPNSPAQSDPYIMYTKDIKKYEKYVKAQAARYPLNI